MPVTAGVHGDGFRPPRDLPPDLLEQAEGMHAKLVKAELKREDGALFMGVMFMFFLWSLPRMGPWKKWAETRMHVLFPMITVLNVGIFIVLMKKLKMVEFNELFFGAVKIIEVLLDKLETALLGIVVLVGLAVVWKFKDRLFDAMGVHNVSNLFGDWRDWATCWSMQRFRPIELFIWKIEGLPSASMVSNNDIFMEIFLGYNMSMRTRVHTNCGHTCIFRETCQFNFDEHDDEENMEILVKNQDVVGATEVARITLGAQQINRLEELGQQLAAQNGHFSRGGHTYSSGAANLRTYNASKWQEGHFVCLDLIPVGKLWLRLAPVIEDEPEGLFSRMFSTVAGGKSTRPEGDRGTRMPLQRIDETGAP